MSLPDWITPQNGILAFLAAHVTKDTWIGLAKRLFGSEPTTAITVETNGSNGAATPAWRVLEHIQENLESQSKVLSQISDSQERIVTLLAKSNGEPHA